MIIVLGGWLHTQDLHPFNFLATIMCHAIMLECVCNWGLQMRVFCLESGVWVLVSEEQSAGVVYIVV